MAGSVLVEGDHGRIIVAGERVRKVIHDVKGNIFLEPCLKPLQVFWAHKIAALLFPGQVLEYNLAVNKKFSPSARGQSFTPAFLESKPVKTSEPHKTYVKWFYEARKTRSGALLDEIRFAPPLARFHFKQVKGSKALEVSDAVKKMKEFGVNVNDNPVNIDFIDGKPFFFEVNGIDMEKLLNSTANHPKKAVLRKYLERYLEAGKPKKLLPARV
ncbi:MAG: hypothetical protein ACP5O3_01310 [Candidatus Micrarchaeia archaeon]|jgi:hypothetical protein